ncbi:MAG TPA: chemotaxis protein CheD [Candidatus Angelobacter sp.]|nr:chemotaxis protein CheD [Candidatus Angelobacter sp.]
MKTATMETGEFAKTSPYQEVYLHPGQAYISPEPVQISMILGSCAGVCLYDRRKAIGGATHYMLPQWDGSGTPSTRYGDIALDLLLKQFQIHGSNFSDLEAKIFGGACMFQAFRAEDGSDDHIGSRNINVAVQTFFRLGIVIATRDTGGENGRKIKMQSDTGSIAVSVIRNS